MAALSAALLGGGLALGAAGTFMQFQGMQKQAAAQKAQAALGMEEEQTRQAALRLDATRRTRESVRQSFIARGQAENQAANSGSQYGSMLPGVEGQIAGQTSFNIAGVQGNRELGESLSKSNIEGYRQGNIAREGGMEAAMGAGVTSMGGMILNGMGTFTRLGTYATS